MFDRVIRLATPEEFEERFAVTVVTVENLSSLPSLPQYDDGGSRKELIGPGILMRVGPEKGVGSPGHHTQIYY